MINRKPIRILFVCHGNICRSPMAEFILKKMVREKQCESDFEISSAAVSTEELGNPVYPPARRILLEHGMDCRGKYARQVVPEDYGRYDYILCAESGNIRNLKRIIPSDDEHKIHLMLDFSSRPRNISDPWYSGDFQEAYRDIVEACQSLMDYLIP